MAVTTDDGGTWQSKTLLRADDVDNALSLVAEAEICEAKGLDVLLESNTLCPRVILLDKARNVLQCFPGGGGDVLEDTVS